MMASASNEPKGERFEHEHPGWHGWNVEERGPLLMERTYEGCVLDTYERNGYDDSDFYAIVWDGERIRSIEYGTTRGWTYPNHAKVDATPEVIAAARASAVEPVFEAMWEAAVAASQRVENGRLVRLKRNRKGKTPLTKGQTGWVGEKRPNPFRTYYRNGYNNADAEYMQVVDFDLQGEDGNATGRRVIAMSVEDVEVVNPDQYLPDPAQLREQAEGYAAHYPWRSLLEGPARIAMSAIR